MANGSELHGSEGDRTLAATAAMDERIPSFTLDAADANALYAMLEKYGPYSNGKTAVFWHIVGVIGNHRREPIENPRTPAGKLLGVEIEPPCACSEGYIHPLCLQHGIVKLGSQDTKQGRSELCSPNEPIS